MVVTDTGKAIAMPTGEAIKGRLFNVTGDPIDGLPAVPKVPGRAIHELELVPPGGSENRSLDAGSDHPITIEHCQFDWR